MLDGAKTLLIRLSIDNFDKVRKKDRGSELTDCMSGAGRVSSISDAPATQSIYCQWYADENTSVRHEAGEVTQAWHGGKVEGGTQVQHNREAGRSSSAQHNGDSRISTQAWYGGNTGVTAQSLLDGNVEQGRVLTIAQHSQAGQGDGDYLNSQGKAGILGYKEGKTEGLHNTLDKAELCNKERHSGQARAAISAVEIGQAEGRTPAGYSRCTSARDTKGGYESGTLIEQWNRYAEGEAWQERHGGYAEKDVWPGTNHTNKSEQTRLNRDGVKPWSKAMTDIDKSEDSADGTGTEGTGTEPGQVRNKEKQQSLR